MERALEPILAGRIAEDYPGAALHDVRCRSSSCTIEYDLPAANAKEIWFYLQLTMPHGPSTSPDLGTDDGSGVVRATFETRFDEEITGADDYLTWLETVRPMIDDTRAKIRESRARGVQWWR